MILLLSHQMVSPTHVCVDNSEAFKNMDQMPLLVPTVAWKVHTLTASPSHTELQALDSTSGHLLEQFMKLIQLLSLDGCALALIQINLGHCKSLHS